MKLNIVSFGYRHGKFRGDKVYDCRGLKNPHNRRQLKELDGRQVAVATFVFSDPAAEVLYERAIAAIQERVEDFQPEIFIGFGCVGGKHRSVALAERVAQWGRLKGIDTTLFHRELRAFG